MLQDVLLLKLFVEMILSTEVEISFEFFGFVSIVDVFLTLGRDVGGNYLNLDPLEVFIVEVSFFLEAGCN